MEAYAYYGSRSERAAVMKAILESKEAAADPCPVLLRASSAFGASTVSIASKENSMQQPVKNTASIKYKSKAGEYVPHTAARIKPA